MIKSCTKSWNSLLDDRALIMIRIFIKRFNSLRNTIKYLTKLSYSVPNTRWSNRLLNDRIPAPVIQVLTKQSTSLHDTIPHQFLKFFTKRLKSLLNYKIPSMRRLAIRRARREKEDFWTSPSDATHSGSDSPSPCPLTTLKASAILFLLLSNTQTLINNWLFWLFRLFEPKNHYK